MGTTSVPYSIVENEAFRNLIDQLDPRYSVPGRRTIGKEVNKLAESMRANIMAHMSSARMIHFCADNWSKRGQTSTYLGITAHFFSYENLQPHSVLIGLREMLRRHTGDYIREIFTEVIDEWQISRDKIGCIITDNGSNIIKAFRESFSLMRAGTVEDEEIDDFDECGLGEDSEFEEQPEQALDNDIAEFQESESAHNQAFDGVAQRISCFSHTLQLVVNKLIKHPTIAPVIDKVYKIVRKVNLSTVATPALITLTGKKLVSHCPTRWSSTFLVISRLLEVKEVLIKVLEDALIDGLFAREWKMLEEIKDLLEPFAESTSLLSGDQYTTLSGVYLCLVTLHGHLDEFQSSTLDLSQLIPEVKQDMINRFSYCLDPEHANFEPVFVMSTLLDPRNALLLEAHQIEAAKKELLKHLATSSSTSKEEASSSSAAESVSDHNADDASAEPPSKKMRWAMELIEQRRKETVSRKSKKNPPGQQQLKKYVSKIATMKRVGDPIKYWVDRRNKYPQLAGVAIDYLTIPASSTPAERAFSTAGESTSGRRNRLEGKNLETEILLRKNRLYVTSRFDQEEPSVSTVQSAGSSSV